jgi:hypothetical protein
VVCCLFLISSVFLEIRLKRPNYINFMKKYISLFPVYCLLLTVYCSAQAWTKGKGQFYFKSAYGTATAMHQYTFDGQEKLYADNVEENAFFDRSLYAYGEFGLKNNLTLFGGLPYKRTIVRDATYRYRTYAFGTATLGARMDLRHLLKWQNSNNALAANLSLHLPTGYTRNYLPSAGSGQADAQLSANYGRSFYPKPIYAQAGIGYRHRSNFYGLSKAVACQEGVNINCFADRKPDYSDDVLLNAEAGYTLKNRILVQGIINGSFSTKAPNEGFSVTNPIPTRQYYLKTGIGASVKINKHLGISGQFFVTPYGKNTINSTDIFLGIEVF